MTDSKIFISNMPGLCDECGRSLAGDVLANPDRNAFSQHCPHLGVVATAYTGQYEGKPAIFSWALQGKARLFWDESNWQALCQPHHDSTKQRMERSDKTVGCDINGNPLEKQSHW